MKHSGWAIAIMLLAMLTGGQTHAATQTLGYGSTVEGAQPLVADEPRERPHKGRLRFRIAFRVGLEIGDDLEQIGELGIELVQKVEEQAIAQ